MTRVGLELRLGVTTSAASPRHPRFTDARFDPIAVGDMALGLGATGSAITALQRALWDLGYPTRNTGFTGTFDADTVRALRQFQKDESLPITGVLDRKTFETLEDKAPPVGAKAVRYPEYDRMFEDGILDVTLATGYIEQGVWPRLSSETSRALTRLGFKKITAEEAAASLPHLPPGGRYWAKRLRIGERDIIAVIRFIDPSSVNPVDQFLHGLAQSDLVLYNGHGRAGAGQDFDAYEKIAGNVVMGESHDPVLRQRLKDRPNDVASLSMTPRYQCMFFRACDTKRYLDPLRANAAGKNEDNLDVLASVGPLLVDAGVADIMTVLEGVLARRSVNDMVERLAPAAPPTQKAAPAFNGEKFVVDGFGGNQWSRR